jgi:nitrogen fixation protein NifU and related proteins
MAYSDKVIDHYENPRNVGKLEIDDTVGTGMVGAPACGDVMKLQIKVQDGIITDAKFKTYGCGSAIASSSLVTEWVKGKSWQKQDLLRIVRSPNILHSPQLKYIAQFLLKTRFKRP